MFDAHDSLDCGRIVSSRARAYLRPGLGGDFSGAKRPQMKIWIGLLDPTPEGPTVVSLRNNFSYAALGAAVCAFLCRTPDGVALLDFPFGLAEPTVTALGLAPSADPRSIWKAVRACGSPSVFRERARSGRSGNGSERQHKRETDRIHGTPWAPHNLRLCPQTFAGMTMLAELWDLGVQIFPWADVDNREGGWLGEGCPRSTLMALGLPANLYKGASADRSIRREEFVRFLEESQGLRWADERLRKAAVADVEGDALDALLLALAASSVNQDALAVGRAIIRNRPTEGVVYT
jgi:hypothetical protein